jgi:gluconolactonase
MHLRKIVVALMTILFVTVIPAFAEEAFKSGIVETYAQGPEKWEEGFFEGPVFDKDGTLWVIEIYGGYIGKFTPEGKYERFLDVKGKEIGGGNGMKMDRKGRLIIAHRSLGIISVDIKTKKVETVVDNYKGKKFNGCNDLFFDPQGNLWFTDPHNSGIHNPIGAVYRLSPEGELFLVMNGLAYPNGIARSPDGRYLFVTEMGNNRLIKAWLWDDLQIGFSFSPISFQTGWGPDGMVMDKKGNLYIAQFDGGAVNVVTPTGTLLGKIETPASGTTNVTFGPDGKTLYITEGWTNAIYRVKTNQEGLPLYHETWKN